MSISWRIERRLFSGQAVEQIGLYPTAMAEVMERSRWTQERYSE